MSPSSETLEGHLQEATRQLYSADPETVTVNSVRQHAEEQNDLEKGFFMSQDWKARSKTLITKFVQELIDNEPSSSIPDSGEKQSTGPNAKRSSTDELSSPPPAKRRKATSTAKSKAPKPKREPSSSALSELSDSDAQPKKGKRNSKVVTKKAARKRGPDSDSELSDYSSSDHQPNRKGKGKVKGKGKEKGKGKTTKPLASPKAKEVESDLDSELSDLSSSEDNPKPAKKPAKKRENRSKKSQISDDSDSDADNKASVSRPKGKESAAITKSGAKPTKVELTDETDVAKGGANEDKITTEGSLTKDEALEGGEKVTKEESKLLGDNSDSSLSSVIDDPPPKKRKGKGTSGVSKTKPSASKEPTGDETEIKKLQGQLVKCGVRKIWGIELKKYGSDSKAKIRHLRDMLHSVGMDGRFSEAKAKGIKERRELMGELEAVNEMNELWGLEGRQGRASRTKAARKPLKEESHDDDDDDDKKKPNDGGEDGEEEEATTKTKSRMSKRMADLAFLGSDDESE